MKKKQNQKSPAHELYISPLFRLSLKYAQKQNPDAIYILSAKHGLLDLNETIEPYEESLVKKKKNEIIEWGLRTKSQLESKSDLQNDEFIFLSGEKYQQGLRPYLSHVSDPLHGKGLGKRLKFLKEAI